MRKGYRLEKILHFILAALIIRTKKTKENRGTYQIMTEEPQREYIMTVHSEKRSSSLLKDTGDSKKMLDFPKYEYQIFFSRHCNTKSTR